MQSILRSASPATLILLPAIASCGGSGASSSSGSSVTPTVTITNKPISVAANATYTFNASVDTGSASTVIWSIPGGAFTTPGTFSSTTGASVTYTAPATPPIYTAGAISVNGTVQVSASYFCCGSSTGASDSTTFTITAPSVSVTATPATASVALGAMQPIVAYAVGAVNNGIGAQVNGVTGGSMSAGTIALVTNSAVPGTYLYAAPSAMPMTGSTVTITFISQADPTKSASTIVTLH